MTAYDIATQAVVAGAGWLRLILETIGAITIAAGGAIAVNHLVRSAFGDARVSFTAARFTLARYVALALEFQLAADVLETAIAPEWSAIGQLAAIATIRTALNYFLSREIGDEQRELTPTAAAPSESTS